MYDLVTDFEPSNGRPTSDYVLSKWESCNDRVVSLVTCCPVNGSVTGWTVSYLPDSPVITSACQCPVDAL